MPSDTEISKNEDFGNVPPKEKILCPICKDGMKCENLVSHAKFWDTEK